MIKEKLKVCFFKKHILWHYKLSKSFISTLLKLKTEYTLLYRTVVTEFHTFLKLFTLLQSIQKLLENRKKCEINDVLILMESFNRSNKLDLIYFLFKFVIYIR